MNRHQIIKLPNPNLRKKSKTVTSLDANIKKIIDDMKSATIDWDNSRDHEVGVALAAVQIDKLYRIVIIRDDHEDKSNQDFTVYLNPKITKYYGELEVDFEGCLSIADTYGKVSRYSKVKVEALDINLRPISITASGFMARIFQHEIDHTNGIVFIDHIKEDSNAFYRLNDKGELEKQDYEQIKKSNILW